MNESTILIEKFIWVFIGIFLTATLFKALITTSKDDKDSDGSK